ncbi:type IV toxin-antitoxin system AbiEi family antitoxin [Glutamicibacter sp. BW77]|uniref:type IV toxin-antitoxin system AbiEi family antitoxin n=1 Tax=Glutamicibacter TaxID=1742989 RepID=UPI000BB89B9F|nr:type IV toxin-antitoxin system AbiEi family antitoxin [Glutamicibacter sp. BW77]PCC35840.1 hypothetical protein CIK74_07625 [Glutamicibacter sp. BW77]
MNRELAAGLLERFEELGLKIIENTDFARISTDDALAVTLAHEHGQGKFLLGYTDTLTATSQQWRDRTLDGCRKLLLVGPRITERSAEIFRLQGINYIDQAGNAFVSFEGVHIDIRGRRAPRSSTQRYTQLKRGGVNLFSLKRSQIIFAFLTWPGLLQGPIRQLARAAGTSIGQTQETLELLTQYGFLDDHRKLSSQQREILIDQWAASYPTGLGSQSRTHHFAGDWSNLKINDQTVYVGGEAAAPVLVQPESVVLYTDGLPMSLLRARRWRRDNEAPNIFIRQKFWEAPDEPDHPGIYQAPLLLTYADLLASNDGRQREAAIQLRESSL